MTKILVAYHGTDGQTAKIAHRVTSVLEESGAGVEMQDAEAAHAADGRASTVTARIATP